jgi:LysM repeat protein
MKTKIKIPKLFRSKKLRATATRRPLRIAATANYDDINEPNMKLSRALLIVLLLHIVAVAGIIAFNAIKTRQSSASTIAGATNPAAQPSKATDKPSNTSSAAVAAAKPETKISRPTLKPADKEPKGPTSSGKTYVVAKGDSPVIIAKKFKVPYDDLVALNHIDDPRKLKIGQKIVIPAKPVKRKQSE